MSFFAAASRTYPRLASLSWTSFTEEDPMSSPSASLLFAISLPSRLAGTLPFRYQTSNKLPYLHLPAAHLPTTTEIHGCLLTVAMPVAVPVAPASEQFPRVLHREPERESVVPSTRRVRSRGSCRAARVGSARAARRRGCGSRWCARARGGSGRPRARAGPA